MYKNIVKATFLLFLLSGCAERRINILDSDGKIVGECVAGYDWHWYGLQDSIDYMLYQCAKDSIEQGLAISDPSLLNKDFTLPKPLVGETWNKKQAMSSFHGGSLSEQKLGYVLAAIEHEYNMIVWAAEDKLAEGKITDDEFQKIEQEARLIWLGE